MKYSFPTLLCATLTLFLVGCATAPDPAKVCTSEWIGKRSNIAIGRIESKAGRSLKSLQKVGKSWAKGGTPNMFQMLALTNALKSLEKELKYGRGIKDLKTLSTTCNDPKIISDAMGGFFRDQGLPDDIINFIEGMGLYQDIITPEAEGANRA